MVESCVFEQVLLFHVRISEWVLPFLEQVLPFYAHCCPQNEKIIILQHPYVGVMPSDYDITGRRAHARRFMEFDHQRSTIALCGSSFWEYNRPGALPYTSRFAICSAAKRGQFFCRSKKATLAAKS
jgi:hypothetical protein